MTDYGQAMPGENAPLVGEKGQAQPPLMDENMATFLETASTPCYKMLWFWTSVGTCFMAVAGIFVTVERLELVDSLEMCYIAVFSAMLAIESAPSMLKLECVKNAKRDLGWYVHAITRYTFKGLFFIYLGSMLITAYYLNTEGWWVVAGVCIGFVAVVVGILTFAQGYQKSNTLDKMRQDLRMGAVQKSDEWEFPNAEKTFEEHAKRDTFGREYLTDLGFNKMLLTKGLMLHQSELHRVFLGISTQPKRNTITREDFLAWVGAKYPVAL